MLLNFVPFALVKSFWADAQNTNRIRKFVNEYLKID